MFLYINIVFMTNEINMKNDIENDTPSYINSSISKASAKFQETKESVKKLISTNEKAKDSTFTISLPGFQEEEHSISLCKSLSYTERLTGFAICFVFGFLLSFLSWFAFFRHRFVQYGVITTLGNVCTICSSFFLAGPMKQIKNMVDPNRLIATVIYFFTMILTLVVAFTLKNGLLVIICSIIQYVAMTWYSLSYIPFARQVIKSIISKFI